MGQEDDAMPEEYLRNAAKLAEFLEDREALQATFKYQTPNVQAKMRPQLAKFDQMIDELETMLATEYERIQAEKAKDARLTELADDAWEKSKHIYIMIKHQQPHLLDSFTERVIDPMIDEDREEFLDAVAILETTKLNAILKGET
jgi:hypothetical protein